METIISFNKYQFWAKVAFSILYGAVATLIIKQLFNTQVHWPKSTVLVMYIILVMVFIGIFLFLTSLCKLPTGIVIDASKDTLLVRFLFKRTMLINLNDVQSYGSTYVNTKGGSYGGILLHLTNGNQLLLSDFSLKDYKPVEDYLKSKELAFVGQEKFRYLDYYFKNKSTYKLPA
jgi:hypothetical protein